MNDTGMPSAARVALCHRMGLRLDRADPAELDSTIGVIAGPVVARLLRNLSLRIDSPGELLVWAREIERDSAVLRAAMEEGVGRPTS